MSQTELTRDQLMEELTAAIILYGAELPADDPSAHVLGFQLLDIIDAYIERRKAECGALPISSVVATLGQGISPLSTANQQVVFRARRRPAEIQGPLVPQPSHIEHSTEQIKPFDPSKLLGEITNALRGVKGHLREEYPSNVFRGESSSWHTNRQKFEYKSRICYGLATSLSSKIDLNQDQYQYFSSKVGRDENTVLLLVQMKGVHVKGTLDELIREEHGGAHIRGCTGDLRYTEAWLERNGYDVVHFDQRSNVCDCRVLCEAWRYLEWYDEEHMLKSMP